MSASEPQHFPAPHDPVGVRWRSPQPTILRSIREQRRRILKLLRDNPSLKSLIDAGLADAYDDARYGAGDESGLPVATFPATCPYSFAQALDPDFLPD